MAGIGEAGEDLFVQAFVPQAAVEAFDQPILLRFPGVDVVPGHAGIARLLPGRRLPSIAVTAFQDRGAGELGGRITDKAVGFGVNPDHPSQPPRRARTRKADIGDQPRILAGAVIVDGQNAELAPLTWFAGKQLPGNWCTEPVMSPAAIRLIETVIKREPRRTLRHHNEVSRPAL